MPPKLGYLILFVADMDRAVKFYRDTLGFPLKFTSPGWSEFATGETTLALHPASAQTPPGSARMGVTVSDSDAFYREMTAKGVKFPHPPEQRDFGGVRGAFVDSEGAVCTVSGA
jgi:catechol 2,3-dioxygenase-like lactoylglutathione lyase family enzyme